MAYDETEWINNSLPAIDEINLNNIEDGIVTIQSVTDNHISNKVE